MALPSQAPPAVAPLSNPSSFAEAYRDYAQRVGCWACSLGGAGIDPEDVVQDVFMVVNRKLASFKGGGGFPAWLFEITRRVVANHRRRHGRRPWTLGTDHDLESAPSATLDPAAELERRMTVDLLYRALDQLPEKYRTVFVLYEIEEMSGPAIAELCRLNPSTVRVHVVRARARFIHAYQKLLQKPTGLLSPQERRNHEP